MSRLILKSSWGLGSLGIASYFWGIGGGNGGNKSSNSTSLPPPSSPNSNSNSNLPIKPPSQSNSQEIFDPSSINPEGFYKYGFPGPIHDLGKHSEFISCYDRSKKNPYWVIEHLTKESITRNGDSGDRKKSIFKEDESIPFKFRNKLRDYFRSGYDRGHQAPAANAKYNQLAMDETFYLTNISPQIGEGFNRDYWNHFEEFVRRLTSKYDNIRVMTGPLYLPKLCKDGKYRVEYEVIGSPPNISVPTHFFKLIIGENNNDPSNISCAAFVLPNQIINNNIPLTQFQVPIDALERSSGLELLQKLPYYNKKDLCKEVKCEIIVREFPKQVNNVLALPSGGGK
ncbi:NUC1 [Candida pseudojiufengensis]|uniref:NUC1 n=1 Tax=Candida pseudojiufengensis TaxID=497109 RepID=UPI002224CB3B|nr:NUC1 [Candida pseudojiufengensis]KAI5964257.1 NUC1 [Candida pseudojiufengensis]